MLHWRCQRKVSFLPAQLFGVGSASSVLKIAPPPPRPRSLVPHQISPPLCTDSSAQPLPCAASPTASGLHKQSVPQACLKGGSWARCGARSGPPLVSTDLYGGSSCGVRLAPASRRRGCRGGRWRRPPRCQRRPEPAPENRGAKAGGGGVEARSAIDKEASNKAPRTLRGDLSSRGSLPIGRN